jgi:MOSC domain-containing protein YiiM
MTADLVACVAALLSEDADALAAAGITGELNLQGWLGARNLRLIAADRTAPDVSPGFWIAEHAAGRCTVMFDESPYGTDAPSDLAPTELRRALVLVPLDPSRPLGASQTTSAAAAGTVEALLSAPGAEAPMVAHERVKVEAGRGVMGDRYHTGTGTFSAGEKHGQEITLVEAEALESLRSHGLNLTAADARRNVVTRGIDLNALVGTEFDVGDVRCVGRRLCEPCSHLQRLNGVALLRPMVHRGGLRADVLTSGTIVLGDELRVVAR